MTDQRETRAALTTEALEKALRRAFQLGQTYWQQADSESYSQNAKADVTAQKFADHVTETVLLFATLPSTPSPTDDRIFEIVGEVLGQPLIADDLREGFTVHTEPRDWVNFARALLAAPPNRQKDNESTAITGDGMAPTDEQILAIGRQHFRPGHDPKAEPAFVAAVRAILAASAQGSNDARDVKRLDFLLEDGAIIDTITNGEGEKRYHLYWPGFDESQRAWYCTPRAAIDAQMAAISTAPDTEIEAMFAGRAENTAVIAADHAANSQRAEIIARAVAAHGREWPEQLTSGVMFYEGERITKAEFLAEVRG